MEERYKQINSIIEKLVLANPYITKEHIAKARALYSMDTRPIETIEGELREYSSQILENAKKQGNAIPDGKTKDNNPEVSLQPIQHELMHSLETEPEEDYMEAAIKEHEHMQLERAIAPPVDLSTQDELDAMFNDPDFAKRESDKEKLSEILESTPKQFIKTVQSDGLSTNDGEGGFINSISIIALALFLSIATIIMNFFTIIGS